MGAEQSSGRAESNARHGSAFLEYYQLLGVDRKATDEEIKKAYRKKALELHPDRNYGDVENATKLFAEVQTAYEVLSDPHERAWYDSHQDVLVHGSQDSSYDGSGMSMGGLGVSDLVRMIVHLPAIVDYTDSSSGFYTTVRELFDKIAAEEYVAADDQGVHVSDYPSFGHAADDYEAVVKPFYAVWGGFATRKTFAWRDIFKLSEAPDRRIRRTMEKENKRERDEGIREYNDVVRALLSRVRKRDRRYVPNRQTEEERQKALRDAAAAQAARSRAANRIKLEQQMQPKWTTSKGESSTTEVETSGADEEVEEEETFECVACGKTFKSEQQFEAHEESRKHRKRVQHLRRKMQEEEKRLRGDDGKGEAMDGDASHDADTENEEQRSSGQEHDTDHHSPTALSSSLHSAAEDEDEQTKELSPDEKLYQSPAKSDRTIRQQAPSASIDAALQPSSTTSEEEEDDTEDEDYAPRRRVERRVLGDRGSFGLEQQPQSNNHEMAELADVTNTMSLQDQELEDSAQQQPTNEKEGGKAKQKRAKKKAAAVAAQQESAGNEIRCARCSESFPSRTKLFEHINALGHAQPIDQVSSKGNKNKSKGKGKKR